MSSRDSKENLVVTAEEQEIIDRRIKYYRRRKEYLNDLKKSYSKKVKSIKDKMVLQRMWRVPVTSRSMALQWAEKRLKKLGTLSYMYSKYVTLKLGQDQWKKSIMMGIPLNEIMKGKRSSYDNMKFMRY